MCYLGYTSRAKDWQERGLRMADSPGHVSMALAYAGDWTELAGHAKKHFNLCYDNVIHSKLSTY